MKKSEELKVTKEIFDKLVYLCQIRKVNYLTMSKEWQELLLDTFVEGFKYFNENMKGGE